MVAGNIPLLSRGHVDVIPPDKWRLVATRRCSRRPGTAPPSILGRQRVNERLLERSTREMLPRIGDLAA